MARLAGKVAVVTGGAKGLGESDVRLFIEEGAQVVITDVDTDSGQRLADEFDDEVAIFLEHDVRNEQRWQEVFAATIEKFGRIDVLVNNAGMVIPGTIENQTTGDFQLIMSVHVEGVFFGTKHVLPYMKKAGGGSIINMTSTAAVQGERYVLAYCAAKSAISGITRSSAVHCKQEKYNIRVNCIAPSGIDTPMVQAFGGQMEAAGIVSGAEAASPLGEAKDVAYMALYLASDESRFVSGTTMLIDNTMTITTGSVPL